VKPASAPTLLIGVGPAGGRVASEARRRLAGSALFRAGGIAHCLLEPGDRDLTAIREAAISLTRQETITTLETGLDIRGPGGRYVRLCLICTAALHEVEVESLTACLRAFYDLEHPAGACEILFMLDAADPENPDTLAPGVTAALNSLREAWEERSAASRRKWTASPRTRFIIAHPHRADGSRLDAAPGSDQALSEYEETLVSALATHVEWGQFHDALLQGPAGGAPFALFGWASDILPRTAILNRAADLLAADLLELTDQPVPHDVASPDEAAADSAIARSDRRRLLIRLLLDDRLRDGVRLGEIDDPNAPESHSLRVQQQIAATNWSDGPPRRWPAAIRELQKQAQEETERLLPFLDDPDLRHAVEEEMAASLLQHVDELIRRRTNGTAEAKALLERAAIEMDGRGMRPEDVRFERFDRSSEVSLARWSGFEDLWPVFEARCRSLPGWGAAITAGAFLGAIGGSAFVASIVLAVFAWIPAGIAFIVVMALYVWALNSTRRMGYQLLELLRSDLGRRLFDAAQNAAGTPRNEGIYQSLSRRLREVEIPAVDRFIAERRDLINAARVNPAFTGPGGTDAWMLGADAAETLRCRIGDEIGDTALSDDTRHLLDEMDPFAAWRQPDMDAVRRHAAAYLRGRRVENWDARRPAAGDFTHDLIRPTHASDEDAVLFFQNWVRDRMDRLAHRAAPLALLPSIHFGSSGDQTPAETDCRFSSVTISVPASLQWPRAAAAGAGRSDDDLSTDRLPVVSAAADLAAWIGAAGDAGRCITAESDSARCMVIFAGLEPGDIIEALGACDRNRAGAGPVPGSERVNGNGRSLGLLRSSSGANGGGVTTPEIHSRSMENVGQAPAE